jgi:hypothetical protein
MAAGYSILLLPCRVTVDFESVGVPEVSERCGYVGMDLLFNRGTACLPVQCVTNCINVM